MGARRRLAGLLLAAVLCTGMFLPIPAGAADLYFTALNDSITPLTSATMPFWSGGSLYVPYTVFDASLNEISVDLGLRVSYNNRISNMIVLYNNARILSFDLESGTCKDEMTGTTYSSRAIMRNGRPFLPLGMVCSFFGLTYSYTSLSAVPQGYLVRVKSGDVSLPDAQFIDAAGNLINIRLREYTQSLSAAESAAPGASSSGGTVGPGNSIPSSSVPTYLAILCPGAQGVDSALSALGGDNRYGVFFLTPQLIEQEGELVRRILGTGHSVGILAQGDSPDHTRQLLERGGRALERAAWGRTTLAYVPAGQQPALEAEGWVCWEETLLLSPSASVSPSSFASSALRRLEGRARNTYLTLEGGADGARVLPALLRQLASEHFVVSIPMETKL